MDPGVRPRGVSGASVGGVGVGRGSGEAWVWACQALQWAAWAWGVAQVFTE